MISTQVYLSTHHLPNWYPLISDFTPETVIVSENDDLETTLRGLAWEAWFLKDYVKSLKTSVGSVVRDPGDAPRVIEEMKKYRGEIEGGICIRKVEDFIPESEVRYFVINGKPFGPSIDNTIPEIVQTVASKIDSPFFSIDLIERTDGEQRVVEIGDGQVSDIVGWSVERFVSIWKESVLFFSNLID